MEESDTEGVAHHGGPDHASASARATAKRWTGVPAGRAMEPRNQAFRGADAVRMSGRQHRRWRHRRESSADPARSENLCMQGVSMRENREIPRPPVWLITWRAAQGRLRPYAWDVRAWEVGSPRSTDEAAEQGNRCGGGGGKGARRGEPGRHDTPRTQCRVRRATRAGSGAP